MDTPRAHVDPDAVSAPGWDLFLLGALLALANFPLLSGRVAEGLILFPDRLAAGEWWRLFTHPFVHVSGYHLLLDGLAFQWLYTRVGDQNACRRLFYLGCAAGGAAVAALVGSPHIGQLGLCGLSGVDHGLMVVCGLELWREQGDRGQILLGVGMAGVVLIKAMAEVFQGQALFASLHFGDVGVPMVACHLGGALGGGLAFGVLLLLGRPPQSDGGRSLGTWSNNKWGPFPCQSTVPNMPRCSTGRSREIGKTARR